MSSESVSSAVLALDCEREAAKIAAAVKKNLATVLKKRGVVIGLSGGVDSAVCAALCVRALGAARVFAVFMPERESSGESLDRAEEIARQLGIEHTVEDLTPALEGLGCYRWRNEAFQQVFPDYRADWKSKIVIANSGDGGYNYFKLVVQSPDGRLHEQRLALKQYLQIVAATNYKQRLRKAVEYFHADRLNYAVIGTPNRLEYDQGFFVKNGDGAADIKPIAHLYKSQVYALARFLELPEAVCNSAPSTDTSSLQQGQDEFYFALGYREMDLALWCFNHQRPAGALAEALDISERDAEAIYRDIVHKRKTTAYLHYPPLLVEPVEGPVRLNTP